MALFVLLQLPCLKGSFLFIGGGTRAGLVVRETRRLTTVLVNSKKNFRLFIKKRKGDNSSNILNIGMLSNNIVDHFSAGRRGATRCMVTIVVRVGGTEFVQVGRGLRRGSFMGGGATFRQPHIQQRRVPLGLPFNYTNVR